MFLLSPPFTLFLMMSLGAAIDLSPLFLRSFIGHEALVENGMMDKRSSNPFSFFLRSLVDLEALKELAARPRDKLILTPHPNAYAYGFNFGKIRGGFPRTQKRSHYATTRGNWGSTARTQENISMMDKIGAFPYGFAYGFNFGRLGQKSKTMLKRSYIPNSPIFWNPKGVKGWFFRQIHPTNEENPVAKNLAESPRKSPTSAGFRLSYGRGGVSYGRG